MPYKSITELPPGIKDNLPKDAQRIWREVFNTTLDSCKSKGGSTKTCDTYARTISWTAIKNAGYKKDPKSGKWKKQQKSNLDIDLEKQTEIDLTLLPIQYPIEVIDYFIVEFDLAYARAINENSKDPMNEAYSFAMDKLYTKFSKGI